ncbi:MAG: hypothetical protein ACE5FL_16155 [Myxococcota bacterium]
MEKLEAIRCQTVRGENYGTPKEIWGFRLGPEKGGAKAIARRFLKANAELLGLEADLDGLVFQRRCQSLGADHIIFQQIVDDRRVHRAYVTVHVSRAGEVFLAKNRALPRNLLPSRSDFRIPRAEAIRNARRRLLQKHRGSMLLDCEEIALGTRRRPRPAVPAAGGQGLVLSQLDRR